MYFEWLFIRVSDGSLELALATLLRVLAIGLPAVALFITIDPTDLADGLAQTLRLPARFVLGALAGLRLIGLAGRTGARSRWRAVREGSADRSRSAGSSAWRSRCSCCRSAAAPCSRRRWRRAGSARRAAAPGRGRAVRVAGGGALPDRGRDRRRRR